MQNKYRNVRTIVDGIVFDSKKEAARYKQLLLQVRARIITNLVLQPSFGLIVNGLKIATYNADFQYLRVDTGQTVVEDVKGVKTPVYRLKKKLLKALHGIDIQEI